MEPVAGGPPTKKQKGPSNAPFAGQARKLAEDPFAIAKAAAPTGQEATKEAFLARLEAQQRAAAAATASAAPSAGAGGDDVVDLCSDSDDDAPIVAAASKPAGQSAAATQAPAARPAAPAQAPAAGPSTSSFRRDSFDPYNPRQYVPPGGFGALMSGGELCVNETAELQNVDGGWDRGLRACLDTGNEGCTLLVEAAAIRAGLVDPLTGDPVGTFGRCETVEVRGVVAGASERVPLMPAAYRIAGREMRVRNTESHQWATSHLSWQPPKCAPPKMTLCNVTARRSSWASRARSWAATSWLGAKTCWSLSARGSA